VKRKKTELESIPLTVSSIEQVMECWPDCSRFWVIQRGELYDDEWLLPRIEPSILERHVHFNFVYTKLDGLHSQSGACFLHMMGKVNERQDAEVLKPHIHGIPVFREDDACLLGLSDHWSSIFLAEYDVRYLAEANCARGRWNNIDVWFRFRAEHHHFGEVRSQDWYVKLCESEANEWFRQRVELLRLLQKIRE